MHRENATSGVEWLVLAIFLVIALLSGLSYESAIAYDSEDHFRTNPNGEGDHHPYTGLLLIYGLPTCFVIALAFWRWQNGAPVWRPLSSPSSLLTWAVITLLGWSAIGWGVASAFQLSGFGHPFFTSWGEDLRIIVPATLVYAACCGWGLSVGTSRHDRSTAAARFRWSVVSFLLPGLTLLIAMTLFEFDDIGVFHAAIWTTAPLLYIMPVEGIAAYRESRAKPASETPA